MDIYSRTHVGKVRANNEDTVYVSGKTAPVLAMVADGMGGQAGGKTASENAVAYISAELGDRLKKVDERALKNAAHNASERIYNIAKRDEAFKNMGTTLAAAIIDDKKINAVNVGDSRIYHLDGCGLKRITKDHKYVQYLVDKGLLTPEEALNHPYRNVITRALGMEDVEADVFRVEWKIGDTLLICSDGLYDEVEEDDIERVLMQNASAKSKADALVELALQNGGRDNISVIVAINDGVLGTLIKNRFEVRRIIAEGGMSRIYLAYDKKEKKNVAVKILKNEFNDNKQIVEGFLHEAEITSRLVHRNIVRTIDYGTKNSYRYIVMEYIEGGTLAELLSERRPEIDECVAIAQKLLSAMSYAHHRGVVHKDLKPHNVLMGADGEPYLTDFGIAEEMDKENRSRDEKVVGSVSSFSPEQATGGKVGPASDVYSMGIMLYEMCTGKLPFVAEDKLSVALMHLHTPPQPPKELNDEIPESLNKIILKAMEKEPEARYRTAAAMGRDIARCLADTSGAYVRMASENDSEKKNSAARMTVIFAVTIGFIGIITWALIAFITQAQEARTVYMPYLLDKKEEAAVDSLEDIDRDLDVEIEIVYEQGIEPEDGTVTAQLPEAGAALEAGDKITVTICKYTQKLPNMPNVGGMTEAEARQYLLDKGFNMKNVVYAQANSDILDNGIVASQYPEPGTEMNAGSQIILYVNRVFVYVDGKIPDICGLDVDDALAGLESYEFRNVFVHARYRNNQEYGSVYQQEPSAGMYYSPTQTMSLYINDIAEPNFRGRYSVPWTVISAAERGEKNKLTVTIGTQYDGLEAELVVFSGELEYNELRNMNTNYIYFEMYSADMNDRMNSEIRYYIDGEEVLSRSITLDRMTGANS